MQSVLTLEEIAELIHEYRKITLGGDLSEEKRQRLSRLDYILSQITLTGEQIMEMRGFDPLLLGNNDIERSTLYQTLEKEHEKLEERYKRLEERYQRLSDLVKKEFGAQFRLKDLIDKQEEEARKEEEDK